ncbi:hypothetical protein ILYODFUR_028816 [Ilyodon furcidens]|uniref:Uncharacterized protein n=1 Tax=Ilyodon furcidens TaxID=33524 RepID=A0ABV0VIG5_9TELE
MPRLSDQDEHEKDTDQTMKVLVIHKPTTEVSLVIEGNRVLTGCGNRTKACMQLMGLIYPFNLEYPEILKNMKYSKTFCWSLIEQSCSKKVHSFKGKRMECTYVLMVVLSCHKKD